MKTIIASVVTLLILTACMQQASQMQPDPAQNLLERGRYLVQIGGCNDCHTAGYMAQAGQVDESLWLMGDSLGWQGPWGTTYAPNLRIRMQQLSEEQWLAEARTREMRPPMPWFALRKMPDDDLRAIYRYIRTLTPIGEPAPAYLPPGVDPPLPKVQFVLPPGAVH